MRRNLLHALALTTACLLVLPAAAEPHDHGKHAHGKQAHGQEIAAGQPTPEEMAVWMRVMTLSGGHDHFKQAVGDWTFTSTMWMAGPEQPPTRKAPAPSFIPRPKKHRRDMPAIRPSLDPTMREPARSLKLEVGAAPQNCSSHCCR